MNKTNTASHTQPTLDANQRSSLWLALVELRQVPGTTPILMFQEGPPSKDQVMARAPKCEGPNHLRVTGLFDLSDVITNDSGNGIAVSQFLSQLHETTQGHDHATRDDLIPIRGSVLSALINMAGEYIDDIATGIEDGLYSKDENQDLPHKVEAWNNARSVHHCATLGRMSQENPPLRAFTVFGHFEESGKIFAQKVYAVDGMHAFFVVADQQSNAVFTAAVPGHVNESETTVVFPGESLVIAQTVLDQPEVFRG